MSVARKLSLFKPKAKLDAGQVKDARTAVPMRYRTWEDGSHDFARDDNPFHETIVPNEDEPLNVLGKPMPGSRQEQEALRHGSIEVVPRPVKAKRRSGLKTYRTQVK